MKLFSLDHKNINTNMPQSIHKSQSDKRVIACNYAEATSACTKGSICYVSQLHHVRDIARVQILARSRSGRWIYKWESIKRLENFRLKTLPKENPLYSDMRICFIATESLLAELQEALASSLQ